MCGRLNVVNDPLAQWVSKFFGLRFQAVTNSDLRPTQAVSTVIKRNDTFIQLDAHWGIKPSWSKKLIINAQSETAATKKTFKDSFSMHRCLVPCTGWYEWRDEGGSRKQKYAFSYVNSAPVLMAGIWFESGDQQQLVTLTTEPNDRCAEIHKRMPGLILPDDIDVWFGASKDKANSLLLPISSELIQIERCN